MSALCPEAFAQRMGDRALENQSLDEAIRVFLNPSIFNDPVES